MPPTLVPAATPPDVAPRKRGRPPKKGAGAPSTPPASDVEIAFERDLCTRTFQEMDQQWSDRGRAEIEHLRGKPWSELVPETHNPLYYLAERCWFDNPRAKGKPEFLYAPLHRDRYARAIIDYLRTGKQDVDGLLLLGPRDTYKSTFADATAHEELLRYKHVDGVDGRVVIRHHKEPMAARGLQRVKAKFQFHPYMRKYWNEYCPPLGVREFGTKTEFTLPNASITGDQGEASLRAVGMTAADTGSHIDLSINDDLVTEEHITSKAVRDDTKARYEANQFLRDSMVGKELNFGTPYHINDLWGSLQKANAEGEARYIIEIVQAMEDKCICGHSEEAHFADGVPLELAPCTITLCGCKQSTIFAHPFRLTKQFLDKKMQSELSRTGRVVLWYLQYQCRARLGATVVADKSWIKYISQVDVSPRAFRILTCDGAWKGTKNAGKGDDASIQVWALERRGSLLLRTLLDGVHSNELTSLDGEREIFRLSQKYGVSDATIEEFGGYAFRTSLEAAAITRGIELNQIDLMNKQMQKEMREAVFLKEMQAGRVFIAKECNPTLKEALIDQILDFPQLQHDDALDSASQTMDPAVVDAYAPAANIGVLRANMGFGYQDSGLERRTRHCAA